ncbi:MAG: DUF4835 family protein [Saprospiraceae bacterium]|nr:DUF4835 family protein [Saprospiraceae bacterium]
MTFIKNIGVFFLIVSMSISLAAQDFNVEVTVNTPKIQTVDPKIFKNLGIAIEEFMNTRDWVEENFEPEERIELNLVITIDREISQTEFEGQITIQASRPIYNSGYNSVLFQSLDKEFKFSYGEYERLDFSENTFTSNLTSVLAFYAYVILGMDSDSFSELGGSDYLQKAQNILNAVPRGVAPGWTSDNGVVNRSRYWIIENLLSARMQEMRRAMYQYYMLGLDRVSQEDLREKGLESILQALKIIQNANETNPGTMWVQLFSDAKRDEIIGLFEVADFNTKRTVYNIMIKLDGTHANDYRVLLK